MATNNKDFRIKNGLVVEGSTATVNGNAIITSASSVNDLADVTVSSPTTGQVLKWNGSAWINDTDATGAGGSGNSFTTIDVPNGTDPVADSSTDTLTFADGANITITGNSTTDTITVAVDSDIINVNSITFDTTPTSPGTDPGTIYWNNGDGLLNAILNANVTIGIGQESVIKVKNATGSTITKGTVVYINGAQGQRPTIALADADSESTSSKTFGIAAESIADGAEGFLVTEGVLRGVNTDGFTEGGAIWLSQTAGQYTQTIPAEPAHAVFLGYAVKANANSGELVVKIQNGYELNELHGVLIDNGSVADNEVLAYDTTSSLWINQTASEAGLATSTHTHGNITNDGKVGSTSGLVLGTTTAGAVAAFTASAPSSPSTEFLRGDGTWVVPTDTNTTYSVSAETATGGANLRLTDSGATTDDVKIASGTNVTVTRTDANTITISSTDTDTNTTYAISAETVAGGANLRLTGSDTTTDDVKIASGTNVTVSRTDANTITIDATDTNTVTRLQGTGGSYVSGDVLIQGTSPISTSQSGNTITIASSAVTSVSGTSGSVTVTGTTTPVISLTSAYGDSVNPYGSKTANTILAAPDGSAGVPSFRVLTATDIPSLAASKITSGTFDIARIPTGTTSTTVALGSSTRLTLQQTILSGTTVDLTGAPAVVFAVVVGAGGGGGNGANVAYQTGGGGGAGAIVSGWVDAETSCIIGTGGSGATGATAATAGGYSYYAGLYAAGGARGGSAGTGLSGTFGSAGAGGGATTTAASNGGTTASSLGYAVGGAGGAGGFSSTTSTTATVGNDGTSGGGGGGTTTTTSTTAAPTGGAGGSGGAGGGGGAAANSATNSTIAATGGAGGAGSGAASVSGIASASTTTTGKNAGGSGGSGYLTPNGSTIIAATQGTAGTGSTARNGGNGGTGGGGGGGATAGGTGGSGGNGCILIYW